MSEVIKVYDEKGHTVLKKRVLLHLNAKAGSRLMVILVPGKREAKLVPYDKREILEKYFPRIGGGLAEEKELERKELAHFEVSGDIE